LIASSISVGFWRPHVAAGDFELVSLVLINPPERGREKKEKAMSLRKIAKILGIYPTYLSLNDVGGSNQLMTIEGHHSVHRAVHSMGRLS
jgi:hypothetical protein